MKRIGSIAVVLLLGMAILVGCAASAVVPAEDLAALQAQLAQISDEISSLRAEMEGLQAGQAAGAPGTDGASSQAPAPAQSSAPALPQQSVPQAAAVDLQALQAQVSEMVQRLNAATEETMFDEIHAARLLENELDRQEDTAEQNFRAGAVSREAFQQLDNELEYLEEQLDDAEDALERKFGFDD